MFGYYFLKTLIHKQNQFEFLINMKTSKLIKFNYVENLISNSTKWH